MTYTNYERTIRSCQDIIKLLPEEEAYNLIKHGGTYTVPYNEKPVQFQFDGHEFIVVYNEKPNITMKVGITQFLKTDRDRFAADLALQQQEATLVVRV